MFWIIIACLVLLDQLAKFFVQASVGLNETIPFISGILDLTYIHNYGAAFSILQNQRAFLVGFTSIAMLAITVYVVKEKSKLLSSEVVALAFIVGGGLGNLIDRVTNGYVVDFINIYILPVFNVADMSVCVGSALLIYSVLILEPQNSKSARACTDGK